MKTFFLHLVVLLAFMANSLGPLPIAQAQTASLEAGELRLPSPGVMVNLSQDYNPPVLKGVTIHPEDPFKFDFILDKGEATPDKEESTKLVKYFLASITTPENDLWVNLSPYEKNRIIPTSFGQTAMGRDLLGEDYILKQITASLIYPESQVGKKFWKRIYEEAAKRYGTTNVPVNTFNKVWIVPDHAKVYEHGNTAYVINAKLKVMLEQDYLSMQKHGNVGAIINRPIDKGRLITAPTEINQLGSQITREIVLPELEKEINEGKNFATLRQVYNSLILAVWFKKRMKASILGQKYMNQNKVANLSSPNVSVGDPQQIYQRYLQAFKKGVYNYIKEEQDPLTQEMIPRKYFSGGFMGAAATKNTEIDQSMTTQEVRNLPDSAELIEINVKLANDAAMHGIIPNSLFEKVKPPPSLQMNGDSRKAPKNLNQAVDFLNDSIKNYTFLTEDPSYAPDPKKPHKLSHEIIFKVSEDNELKVKYKEIHNSDVENIIPTVTYEITIPIKYGINYDPIIFDRLLIEIQHQLEFYIHSDPNRKQLVRFIEFLKEKIVEMKARYHSAVTATSKHFMDMNNSKAISNDADRAMTLNAEEKYQKMISIGSLAHQIPELDQMIKVGMNSDRAEELYLLMIKSYANGRYSKVTNPNDLLKERGDWLDLYGNTIFKYYSADELFREGFPLEQIKSNYPDLIKLFEDILALHYLQSKFSNISPRIVKETFFGTDAQIKQSLNKLIDNLVLKQYPKDENAQRQKHDELIGNINNRPPNGIFSALLKGYYNSLVGGDQTFEETYPAKDEQDRKEFWNDLLVPKLEEGQDIFSQPSKDKMYITRSHSRYFVNKWPDIIKRGSLNIPISRQTVGELDNLLREGIFEGQYKIFTPSVRDFNRNDTVTLYFYKEPSELAKEKFADIARRYPRSGDLKGQMVFKDVPGFTMSEIDNIKDEHVEDLYRSLLIIDPDLAKDFESIFVSKKNSKDFKEFSVKRNRFGMSERQFYSLRYILGQFGIHVSYDRVQGFILSKNGHELDRMIAQLPQKIDPVYEIQSSEELTDKHPVEIPLKPGQSKEFHIDFNSRSPFMVHFVLSKDANGLITLLSSALGERDLSKVYIVKGYPEEYNTNPNIKLVLNATEEGVRVSNFSRPVTLIPMGHYYGLNDGDKKNFNLNIEGHELKIRVHKAGEIMMVSDGKDPVREIGLNDASEFTFGNGFEIIIEHVEKGAIFSNLTSKKLIIKEVDNAMETRNPKTVEQKIVPGGIDLTAKRMNLDVDSDKSAVSQPIGLKALENIEIKGLYIKDIQIKPLKNLPELLGISVN